MFLKRRFLSLTFLFQVFLIRFLYCIYFIILYFSITKATDIHFRELWLAPVPRDIQYYLLILRRKSNWLEARVLKLEKRFTWYCFFEKKVHFYTIILVNTKTTISFRVRRCLYSASSRLGIYPPLFTSPFGW